MTGLGNMIRRNCKLFFKDKGMFFTSLITPLILLLLYAVFLGDVYRGMFTSAIPEALKVSEKLINGAVGGELFSSLLAVSCITVAFCSNMLMVQDLVDGIRKDLTVTPVKRSTLAFGYYISTAISALLICFIATAVSFVYLAYAGWYLSATDVLLIMLDVFLLVMFGTALSSVVGFFMTSQGQITAAGTIVSAAYGFVCGAYMPISSFGEGLQKALMFLPGTYGTSLIRNHVMRGVFAGLSDAGLPDEAINGIKDAIDCNLYFFGQKVSESAMFAVIGGSVALLIAVYVLLNIFVKKKSK